MIRFYTPILLLQVFCLYHSYENDADKKWYFIIFLFPFLGSLFYLYHTFYSRRNVDNLREEVKNTFVSNHKIKNLIKSVEVADTYANKIQLAKEYTLVGNYDDAIYLYESCLNGNYINDPYTIRKLLKNTYLKKDYKNAVNYGLKLKNDEIFKNSEERVMFAWSLYALDEYYEAEKQFEDLDIPFSNYEHRFEFAVFLDTIGKKTRSKELLNQLIHEIESMDIHERRMKKQIYQRIKNYLEKA